jgi:predicted DNA-binding transcriptional regulator AlpA
MKNWSNEGCYRTLARRCRMDSPVFITPEQTAELLGTSLTWVYEKSRRRQRDPLPVLRIGRYLRFEKDVVIAWARAHSNVPSQKITKERLQ